MTKRNPMTYERGECPQNDRTLSRKSESAGSVCEWLESLLTMVNEGDLLAPDNLEDLTSQRWWYEDRDELIRKIKAHLQDSNRVMDKGEL